MKQRIIGVFVATILALFVLAGCEGPAAGLTIVGVYTQEAETGGALVTALDGSTPYEGELAATVNGVDLMPFLIPGTLADSSFLGNLVAGDTVTFVISVEGEEVVNDSVSYPGDIALTSDPTTPSASSAITITWDPVPGA
ncbi:MAG: hypothetical protein ACLFNT_14520, partial [Spirochaetales bacterium]